MTDLLQPHPPSDWRERAAALRQSLSASPLGLAGGAVAVAVVAVVAVLALRASSPCAGRRWTGPG